jgi:hypothetical protein
MVEDVRLLFNDINNSSAHQMSNLFAHQFQNFENTFPICGDDVIEDGDDVNKRLSDDVKEEGSGFSDSKSFFSYTT